jgi:hypothetical protein
MICEEEEMEGIPIDCDCELVEGGSVPLGKFGSIIGGEAEMEGAADLGD